MLTPEAVLESAARVNLTPAAFVIVRLDRPGERIAIDASRYYYPASMVKTPLALAADVYKRQPERYGGTDVFELGSG